MVTWYVHEVDGGYVLEMGGCSACFLGGGIALGLTKSYSAHEIWRVGVIV